MFALFRFLFLTGCFALAAARAEEADVDPRLRRAEEDVALARESQARIQARLEEMEADADVSGEALEAMRSYLAEVTALRELHEETLRALREMVAELPDPAVTRGMRDFTARLEGLPEAEDPDSELNRMLADFDASLNQFDQLLNDHLARQREAMDRRALAGQDAATPRAQAAAEAAALLRGMGVDPGVPGGEEGPDVRGAEAETAAVEPSAPPRRRDEDIVARQLREAAERETDPELREKLWKEYEAYLEGRS